MLNGWKTLLSSMVYALSTMTEFCDSYTAGHQARTASIAVCIAEKMGWDQDKITGLRIAGLLHDLGKLSLPMEYLTKPGKISKAEFSLIQEHVLVGYRILQPIDFHWPVAQTVLQHHESNDGSGYPGGVTGKHIIPEAKIIRVADTLEAMSADRPYRAALGMSAALAEIKKNSGIKYEAEVVDIALKIFDKKDIFFE